MTAGRAIRGDPRRPARGRDRPGRRGPARRPAVADRARSSAALLVGLVPGLPAVELDPDLIFFVFLPPLVYGAGFNSSPRDLRAQARRIGVLAIGLVAATTVAVAVAIKLVVPGLRLGGGVRARRDPRADRPGRGRLDHERLRVDPQLSAVIEGESLVNDGTGLVLYRLAVGATVSGHVLACSTARGSCVATGVGGVAIGLAVGWVISRCAAGSTTRRSRSRCRSSRRTPPTSRPRRSARPGILAAVTVGLYLGARSDGLFSRDRADRGPGLLERADLHAGVDAVLVDGAADPRRRGRDRGPRRRRASTLTVAVTLRRRPRPAGGVDVLGRPVPAAPDPRRSAGGAAGAGPGRAPGRRLGRDARRGVAGRGAGDPGDDRRRRRRSRSAS